MNNKIKELTENIYQEGVSKAKTEADQILEEARQKAAALVSEAEEKANNMLTAAKQEAQRIDTSLREELKAVSEQVVQLTKQELTEVVSGKASGLITGELVNDQHFVGELMLEILRNWQKTGGNGNRLDVLVPESKATQITSLLQSKAGEALAAGVRIKPVTGLQAGFRVINEKEGYKLSFTDADFQSFFTALMKPKLKEYLF